MPKTITYRGTEIEVPFIGAMHLARIAAALKDLLSKTGLDGESAIAAMQAQQYPALILMALDNIIGHLGSDLDLTHAENLFFGSLGLLINRTAADVATAPLDDIIALCQAVFAQEAETQAGKRLMHLLASFGRGLMPNTPSGERPEPTSDTTQNPESPTPETTGTATPG